MVTRSGVTRNGCTQEVAPISVAPLLLSRSCPTGLPNKARVATCAVRELFVLTARCLVARCFGHRACPYKQHCAFVALRARRQLHPSGASDHMTRSAVSTHTPHLPSTVVAATCARPARGVCAEMSQSCCSFAACQRDQFARDRGCRENHKHPGPHACSLSTTPPPTSAPVAKSSLPSNPKSSQPRTAK